MGEEMTNVKGEVCIDVISNWQCGDCLQSKDAMGTHSVD
jgi:rubredoxin